VWRKPPTVEHLQDKGAGVGHLGYQGISGTAQGEQSKPEQQTGLTRERLPRAVLSEVGFLTWQHQQHRCSSVSLGPRPAQEIPLM